MFCLKEMTLSTLEKSTKNGGENKSVMSHSFDVPVPFPSLLCKFTISIHADVGGYAQIRVSRNSLTWA